MAEPVSRPWRTYLRFSVRGQIVLVLAIGTGMGLAVRSAQVQRDAVAAIENAGGYVRYCSETSNGMSWWRRWLFFHLDLDYRHYIDTVYYARVRNDAAMAHAGRLAGIVILEAGQSWVTDAGLVNLGMLTNLSFLDLEESDVSDAGLIHLEGLTRLSTLGLRGTRVTDAGLEKLARLTNLRLLTTELAWRRTADRPNLKAQPSSPNSAPTNRRSPPPESKS